MKKIIITIQLLLSFCFCKAQYFEPIGNGIGIDGPPFGPSDGVKLILNDTINDILLIYGGFSYVDSIFSPGKCSWDGQNYQFFNGNNSALTYNATMWNGYNVISKDLSIACLLGNQPTSYQFAPLYNNYIHDLITYNGDLYAGGSFNATQAGTKGIVKWNGTDWETVGGGLTNMTGPTLVYSLAVYNGDLIVAGQFQEVSDSIAVNNIARWDGTQWHAMGGGGVQVPEF